ncbi:hypothetical protein [Amycolatopsis sp. cg13]|uniref:hypothetical protein n=1 Tax=Amycolatopsis sp. cg13 TaxID=3238807 RepID=UPI0035246DB6
MSTAELPNPVVRVPEPADIDTRALATALRNRIEGEVRFDNGSRATNFRRGAASRSPDHAAVVRVPEPAEIDTQALATALRNRIEEEVRLDDGTYANVRQVVVPRSPAAEYAVKEGR